MKMDGFTLEISAMWMIMVSSGLNYKSSSYSMYVAL